MDESFNQTMQREIANKEKRAQTEMFHTILTELRELKAMVAELTPPKRSTRKTSTEE